MSAEASMVAASDAGNAGAAVRKEVERLLLPATLEMNSLEESFRLLRACFPPACNKYVLDGANIAAVDAAGIQLLVNFVGSLQRQGCQVEWDNYPLPAYQLANELGLVDQLGD
jgi:ABC-type transporter Mla MlaB component